MYCDIVFDYVGVDVFGDIKGNGRFVVYLGEGVCIFECVLDFGNVV